VLKKRSSFIITGIALAIAYWLLEAMLHAFLFDKGTLVEMLFHGDANEMWMRLLISAGFVAFGFYAQHAVERERLLKEQMREQAARQRRIIDSAYDAYVSIDADGRINGWNRRAEEMFGWPAPEVSGRRLEEVIIPESMRAAHVKGMERYLAEGVGNWLYKPMKTRALHRDGHEIAVEIVLVPLRFGDEHQEFFAFIRPQ